MRVSGLEHGYWQLVVGTHIVQWPVDSTLLLYGQRIKRRERGPVVYNDAARTWRVVT